MTRASALRSAAAAAVAQWLSGVRREQAGAVVAEEREAGPGETCTDFRVLHRTVVVLHRPAVPDEAA